VDLRLPLLVAEMEFGTVVKWLKREGEPVVAGEPVVEVEADKANHELEAPASGTLAEIVAAEGDEIAVGGLLAVITTP